MPNTQSKHDPWLDEIVTMTEGAALRRVSIDTLRREVRRGRIKVLHLSLKRRGITRREALTGMRAPSNMVLFYPQKGLTLKQALAEIERLKSS